jgi:hypothetical protein
MSSNKLLFGGSKTPAINIKVKSIWLVFTAVLCLIFALFSLQARSQFDDSAVPVTVDFLDNTEESAVPVIVDGSFSSPFEQDLDAMGFLSGSLYRQFLDRSTNRFSAVVSPVAKARGQYLVATIASTRIPTGSVYAPGQEAAVVSFNMTFNGVPLPKPVTLHVVGAQNTRNGPFLYLVDINGDGTPDSDAGRYGILAKAGYSSLTAGGQPYFVLEMAVPVAGKYAFQSGRMTAVFYTETNVKLSISDGEVTTSKVLSNGAIGTRIDASFVPVFIGVEVSNAIDLQKQGEVPVKIKGLAGLDLRTLDIATIRLRDASVPTDFRAGGMDANGSYYTTGAVPIRSNIRDTGNNQYDLTVWFSTSDMKLYGGFNIDSLSAVLVAKTKTPVRNLAGTAPVRF